MSSIHRPTAGHAARTRRHWNDALLRCAVPSGTALIAAALAAGCIVEDPYFIERGEAVASSPAENDDGEPDDASGGGGSSDDAVEDEPSTDDDTQGEDEASDPDDSASDDPNTDGPARDDSASDDPASDDPASDDPASDDSASDDPASDDSASDDPDDSEGASIPGDGFVPDPPDDSVVIIPGVDPTEPDASAALEDPADAGPSVMEAAPAPPRCGNSRRDPGEDCDQDDLGGRDCSSVPMTDFSGGVLGCTDACEYDTTGCELAPRCGDGVVTGSEECDGDELLGESCFSAGFAGGRLRCTAGCELDTNACLAGPACDSSATSQSGVVYRGNTEDEQDDVDWYTCSDGGSGGDLTIAWTAPETGCYIMSVTSDEDLDTIAAVHESCAATDELACDDNSGSDQLSVVEFDAVANTSYALIVDAYFGSDEGSIVVRISPCAPAAWTCAEDYYGRGDGCDCGCGVVDADCSSSASSACGSCTETGSCAAGASCEPISAEDNARCD